MRLPALVQMDHEQYLRIHDLLKIIIRLRNLIRVQLKIGQRFYLELNYLIPVQLKKTGYEIIRHEEAVEINMLMVKKLARAIHSRYLHEIRNQSIQRQIIIFFIIQEIPEISILADFDDLPDEIKNSNIDNAAHIPTKLLSIGYKIRQVKKGFKPVALHLNEEEIETMARVEHLRWSWEKRLNGWTIRENKRRY